MGYFPPHHLSRPDARYCERTFWIQIPIHRIYPSSSCSSGRSEDDDYWRVLSIQFLRRKIDWCSYKELLRLLWIPDSIVILGVWTVDDAMDGYIHVHVSIVLLCRGRLDCVCHCRLKASYELRIVILCCIWDIAECMLWEEYRPWCNWFLFFRLSGGEPVRWASLYRLNRLKTILLMLLFVNVQCSKSVLDLWPRSANSFFRNRFSNIQLLATRCCLSFTRVYHCCSKPVPPAF